MAVADDLSDNRTKGSSAVKPRRAKRQSLRKRWRRLRRKIFRHPTWTNFAGLVIYGALSFVRNTQRVAHGSSDWDARLSGDHPAIVGFWHGQHLLAPFYAPKRLGYVILLSRNADAEINASVMRHLGFRTVRGSGGRVREAASKKGGVRALIALRQALAEGASISMIADVPKGTPREAGLGIVTLARISGRPILPAAVITSRRYIVQSSWDKTMIPLPFGRVGVVVGEPISVPRDADEGTMEDKRREVTRAIEAAHREADRLALAGA